MKIQNGVLVSYTGQEEHLIIPREACRKPGRSLRESTGLWV